MALKGNLHDFTVPQLFNLINLAQKSGTLSVDSSVNGTIDKVTISFREGKLAYAQLGHEDNSLVTILHRANKLTAAQHSALKARANGMSDKELGLLLVNANYLDQQEVITCLKSYFIHIVNNLFTWGDGLFLFENDRLPPDDKITVRVGLENIIIEGSRRMREWEQLQDEIPSMDMSLKFANHSSANIRSLNLSVDEWRVVNYINPKNSMRQIARANNISDFEMRKIVYGLLQAGLVDIVRPLGGASVPQAPKNNGSPISQKNKEEQRSLINRIIYRIRSL